jgi:hypothetical protein
MEGERVRGEIDGERVMGWDGGGDSNGVGWRRRQ